MTIAGSLALPRSYWLAMTIALVLKPDFGSTFSRGILRLAGTYVGLFVATLSVPFCIARLTRACAVDWNSGLFSTLGRARQLWHPRGRDQRRGGLHARLDRHSAQGRDRGPRAEHNHRRSACAGHLLDLADSRANADFAGASQHAGRLTASISRVSPASSPTDPTWRRTSWID